MCTNPAVSCACTHSDCHVHITGQFSLNKTVFCCAACEPVPLFPLLQLPFFCIIQSLYYTIHNISTMKLSPAGQDNKNTLKTREFHPDWDTIMNAHLTAPHSAPKHTGMY